MHASPGNRQIRSDARSFQARLALGFSLAILASCGGGGGGGGSNSTPPRPTVSLAGAPQLVPAGSLATLTWTTSNATSCSASGGWTGARPLSGSEQVGPIRGQTTFMLTCAGSGGTRDATATLNAAAPASSISGRILVGSTTQVDSDTNDPFAPRIANNRAGTAQVLPIPAIVGGYVALAGRGPAGASQPAGDPADFYRADLAAGQTIELSIATSDPVANDLDLYLIDTDGEVVDASVGVGRVERITVPTSATYYIEVVAYEDATGGAANYRLSIGQTLTNSSAEALTLSEDFVPGELLLKLEPQAAWFAQRRLPAGMAGQHQDDSLGERHGLVQIGGAADRELVYRLGDGDGVRATIQSLGSSVARDAGVPGRRFASDEQQRKWDTLLAVKRLRGDPAVRWAEPNWLLAGSAVPDDPAYARQRWHYEQIQLPAAWDISQGSATVTVAVIDSGVRASHPDFAGALVDGRDFVRGTNAGDGDGIDNNPEDPGYVGPGGSLTFHGTHVAGTVAASGNNGVGVSGVTWSTRIMPVRVLGNDGSGSLADIVQGIRYAARLANDSGQLPASRADIINLSLGSLRSCSQAEIDVIAAARTAGVVVVAAAGNDATSLPASPASCPGVISVAAVNSVNGRAFYSNYGSWVRVAAPGGDSTDRNGDGFPDAVFSTHASAQGGSIVNTYDFLIGTSMAAPHVAGVIALMKAINPALTPAGIDSLLNGGQMTRDIGLPGPDELGVGLIDAFKSAQAASNTPPPLLPQLGLSPRALNFGDVGTDAEVLVSNTGGGVLVLTSIFTPSSWLRVLADQVDASGLGTYRIEVDRAGRSPGTYSGFVEFRSTAGNARVDVLMQITTTPIVANAGRQYVVLVAEDTGLVSRNVAVQAQGESVDFAFSNVPATTYQLLIGSDMNNDGVICDDGEACGAYPVFGAPTVVQPTAADLAFETAFRAYQQSAAGSLGVLRAPD